MGKFFGILHGILICLSFLILGGAAYCQDSDFIDTGIATNSNKTAVQPEKKQTVIANVAITAVPTTTGQQVQAVVTVAPATTDQQAQPVATAAASVPTVAATSAETIAIVETPTAGATSAVQIETNEKEGEGIIILQPGEVEPEKLEQYITKKKPIEEIEQGKEETQTEEQAQEEEETGGIIVLETEGKEKIERAGYILVERAGFISDNFKEDGTLFSVEGNDFLSQEDNVYIKISVGREPKIGSQFLIYQDNEDINDPYTDAALGKLIEVDGVAKVLDRAENNPDNIYKVKIIKSYNPIVSNSKIKFRMDLKQYYNKLTGKMRKKNLSLEAYIIKVSSRETMINNKSIVYIDKGLDDGLLPGEKLTVYRKLPDAEGNDFYDEMGKVLVLNSMKKSSVGMVIKQKNPIKIGDVVKTQK